MPSSAERRQENGDYWEDRLKEISNEQQEKADAVIAYIANRFHRAIQLVERDFTHWYNRLAANNGLSYADELKLLSGDDLDEFHWTVDQYIQYAEEHGLDPDWIKKLENASAKVHIRHLEELEMQMQQYIEELEAEAAEKFEEHLKDVAESTYTDTAKTVEECAPDMSVSVDFDKINPDIVDEVVNKPWATDGKGFSDRLGYDKERLVEELNKAVAQGLLRGQSSEEIAAGLVKQLGISQRNAIRIVRTETAAIASKADMKLYKDLGIDSIKFMASLDGKTCAVCSDMDGKVIPLKQCRIGLNMPPLHPNCRCYTVPVIDDDFAELLEGDERTARDEDGNYIRIPANIDYNGWKTKMVKKAPGNKENNSRRLSKPLEFYYNGSERFIPANAEIEHIKVIAGNGSDFEFRLAQSFAEEYPEGGTAADWSKCVGKVTSDQFEFDIHWIEDKNGKMYVPKIAGKKTMTIRYLGKSFFYGLTDGKTYEAEDARDGFYRVIDDSGEGYLYSKEKPGPLDNPDIRGRWEIVEK